MPILPGLAPFPQIETGITDPDWREAVIGETRSWRQVLNSMPDDPPAATSGSRAGSTVVHQYFDRLEFPNDRNGDELVRTMQDYVRMSGVAVGRGI